MAEQTFKVGDKVTHNIRGKAEVTYGPYTDTFGRTYNVIRLESGREMSVPADVLTALPDFAVGDKAKMDGEREPVEILAGPYTNRYITWYTVKAEIGETTAAEDNLTALPAPEPADRDTFEYDGVVYDLTAEYTDRDGDVWRFARVSGEIRGDWGHHRESVDSDSYSISSAVRQWGPLRKI
jgi:hypothetical protein